MTYIRNCSFFCPCMDRALESWKKIKIIWAGCWCWSYYFDILKHFFLLSVFPQVIFRNLFYRKSYKTLAFSHVSLKLDIVFANNLKISTCWNTFLFIDTVVFLCRCFYFLIRLDGIFFTDCFKELVLICLINFVAFYVTLINLFVFPSCLPAVSYSFSLLIFKLIMWGVR